MNSLKRSRWHKPSEAPAQAGVYEVEWTDSDGPDLWFNMWDGRYWYGGSKNPAVAEKFTSRENAFLPHEVGEEMTRWRGITRDATTQPGVTPCAAPHPKD